MITRSRLNKPLARKDLQFHIEGKSKPEVLERFSLEWQKKFAFALVLHYYA